MLAGLETPEFPLAVGVLRRVKFPTYGAQAREQIKAVTDQKGHGTLASILEAGDTWTVS